MKMSECGLMDQIFSVHYTPEGGGPTVLRHFNPTALLRRWRESKPRNPAVSLVQITPDHARVLYLTRGVEDARLHKYMLDIMVQNHMDPILFVDCDDGTQLQIDGHHKYVAAAAVGVDKFPAVFFPRGSWEWIEITDMPAELHAMLAADVPDNAKAMDMPQMSLKRYDKQGPANG